MYGGYGSVKNVLKNNRNLLRKKSFFKAKKSISDKKQELLKGAQGALAFTKVSDGKLRDIKNKIRKDASERNSKYLIVSLFFIAIFTTLIIFSIRKGAQQEQLYIEQKELKKHHEKLEKYHMFLEEGALQVEKSHWKNATYFYKKALEIFPEDSLATVKLGELEAILSQAD